MQWEDYRGRAARLKKAFPGAYSEEGSLVTFDLEKIKKQLNWPEPFVTPQGVEFTRDRDGYVVISLPTQIGNVLSTWLWYLSSETWEAVVKAMEASDAK